MSNINKQELRVLAVALDGDDWHAEGNSVYGGRYDVGDNVCYDHIASCESVNGESPHADFIAAASPGTVLALLDELEAAQSYAKERDEENQDLMLTVGRLRVERETSEAEMGNALCQLLPGCQYMDPPDGGSVTPLEQVRRMVADYRERIAELERLHLIKLCPKCNDTGMADSGGVQPWGEPIEIECDCRHQDANTAELVYAGIITKVGE